MSQWVQHLSGQGKKYEVSPDAYNHIRWCVKSETPGRYLYLPLDEYSRVAFSPTDTPFNDLAVKRVLELETRVDELENTLAHIRDLAS